MTIYSSDSRAGEESHQVQILKRVLVQ